MSYELSVYVEKVDDSIVEDWVKTMVSFGLECEIHPDFTFDQQAGFLPFKVRLIDNSLSLLEKEPLLSGFELDICDYKYADLITPASENKGFWKRLFKKGEGRPPQFPNNPNQPLLSKCQKELTIRISTKDSLEFVLGWYSAAIVTYLANGIIFDPQEGVFIAKSEAMEHARTVVANYNNSLKSRDWIIHPFENWL